MTGLGGLSGPGATFGVGALGGGGTNGGGEEAGGGGGDGGGPASEKDHLYFAIPYARGFLHNNHLIWISTGYTMTEPRSNHVHDTSINSFDLVRLTWRSQSIAAGHNSLKHIKYLVIYFS